MDLISKREELIELMTVLNSSSYRMRFLEYIECGLLKNELITKEETRKLYYESMATYYSVDHSNPNEIEERWERALVEKVEAAFVEAMKRRELSELEKEEIRIKQAICVMEWERAEEDMKKVTLVNCEKLAEELKKFPWMSEKDDGE